MSRFVPRLYVPIAQDEYELVTSQIAPSLQEGESASDVMSGASYLAARRASLLHRDYQPDDLYFVLSIWTYWPLKPPPPPPVEAQILSLRHRVFADAANTDLNVKSNHPLANVVPDETLVLSPQELYDRQQKSVGAFLSVAEQGT